MPTPLRVLIVEDSEDDALLLVNELRRGGFTPDYQQVDNPDEMSTALVSHEWDLIITDHNMPSFDSSDALSIVKQAGLDIPSIVVSGHISEDHAVEAMREGAQDYVMKDNLKRLIPAIHRELQEAKSRGAHKQAQATIQHMAYHDALTNLANRHEFDRQVLLALNSAKQMGKVHMLFYLDIDQFKVVNDTCGHIAGDEFLKQLARELKRHLREEDTLARLGGDEFGVLLENCPFAKGMKIAEYLSHAVSKLNFHWRDETFHFSCSIGVVVLNADWGSVDDVLTSADIACYTAKEQGRNRIKLYQPDDADLARHRGQMQWVSRINQALEQDRFQLYMQPIVGLLNGSGNGKPLHHEILLRLIEDDGNVLSAGEFIPAAERYGLMSSVDRWVVTKLMSTISKYRQTKSPIDIGTFFVNLSGATLNDESFFTFVRDHLKIFEIPAETLCFEVTETAAIANLDVAVEFINQIRSEGSSFALDDFGAGMCSFSYLKAIPVDYLKIDGGFVKSIVYDQMDSTIVESINRIGHLAGLQTIAEFVENNPTMDKLKAMGVDFAQGYGIGVPKPMD
jgi:diguanylate cyclase (GGDEF)-like protein